MFHSLIYLIKNLLLKEYHNEEISSKKDVILNVKKSDIAKSPWER